MSGISRGFLGFGVAASIVLVLEAVLRDEIDPASLPPPGAGANNGSVTARPSCKDVVYATSQDGIRFVRQAGGGTLIAAAVEDKLGFYELGRYGYIKEIDESAVDPEIAAQLRHGLFKCKGPFLPSGAEFSD